MGKRHFLVAGDFVMRIRGSVLDVVELFLGPPVTESVLCSRGILLSHLDDSRNKGRPEDFVK